MRLGGGSVHNKVLCANFPNDEQCCLQRWPDWGTVTSACRVTSVCAPLCACQASLSMGSSRQEYWSGLPCPPPGDLPDPRVELASLTSPALAGKFFTIRATNSMLSFFFSFFLWVCGSDKYAEKPRLNLFLLRNSEYW